MFELIQLPYELNALEPYMSQETLEYHYGKHHKTYVDKLNGLLPGTEFEWKSLEEIILLWKSGPIFNNAAQIWNHNLFWNILAKNGGQWPSWKLLELIERDFGSVDEMKKTFDTAWASVFGSGWVWLVQDEAGKLKVTTSANAVNPLVTWESALIGCDVWEHSYYIDYRNNRVKYLENFWQIVNWEEVGKRVK